ncbi:Glycosyltransferase [Rhynchospora pubera]|uniref:Glycosyltransferase n=1 Tax=Rhynchospora pubera TaxID=906938 RepID=A0AAV8G7S9_9POAL|nr:Glycosyltransferase [Rhynchospora pubera]
MVPFPAQGHLNQLLHLALNLSSHGLAVHYAAFAPHIQQAKSRLQGWPDSALDNLHFHNLPIPSFSCPPPDPNSTISFPLHLQPLFDASELVLPHIASLLHSLSATSRRIVVIFDRFVSFAAREAATLPNAESYCFQCVPISQDLVFLGHDGPTADLLQSHGLTIPSLDGCITEDFFAMMIGHYKMSGLEYSGILMNTCRFIEGEFIDLLAQQPDFIGKRHFAIGPLNPTTPVRANGQRHLSLEWLDDQPSRDWDRQNEILLAGEIEEAIKRVMVYDSGDEIKQRTKKLGEDVMQAAADGGSSNIELLGFIAHVTRR